MVWERGEWAGLGFLGESDCMMVYLFIWKNEIASIEMGRKQASN